MRTARTFKLRSAGIGLACLAAIASTPLALNAMSQGGIEIPGVSSGQRLMAMLDARSPGERKKGELSKTKAAKAVASGSPRQRALGKVFPPKPTPTEQLAKVLLPAPVAPLQIFQPIVPLTVADFVAPPVPMAAAGLAAVGPAIIGGSSLGGGGGGSSPTNVVTPPLPPVTNAVPEPGTWLMMLVGFGMIGSAMSRRRSGLAQAEVA